MLYGFVGSRGGSVARGELASESVAKEVSAVTMNFDAITVIDNFDLFY